MEEGCREHSRGSTYLVVQHNQVAIAYVESAEVVTPVSARRGPLRNARSGSAAQAFHRTNIARARRREASAF